MTVKDNSYLQNVDTDHNNNKYNDNINKVPIKQYAIPNDPVVIPKFKPINPALTATHTFQFGPIETVTRHTIGLDNDTVYVGVSGDKMKLPQTKPAFLITQYQPSSSVNNNNLSPPTRLNPVNSAPVHHSPIQTPISQPLDLYHTMTLKYSNANANANSLKQNRPPASVYLPVNQPFEIQKSISYELH